MCTCRREHIIGVGKLGLSGEEIIRDCILPAHRFVTDGGSRGGKVATVATPAFSRTRGEALHAGMNGARRLHQPPTQNGIFLLRSRVAHAAFNEMTLAPERSVSRYVAHAAIIVRR